jgi:hypothetical protein
MENMKVHEGAQGWEPGFTGLREPRKAANERTEADTAVCSFASFLGSCVPPEAAPNPGRF